MSAFYQLMRFMRLSFSHYCRVLILCVSGSVQPYTVGVAYASGSEQIEAAIADAERLQLAEHESWLSLLHYKHETVLRRFISQVDDADFFLAENGKSDARAELIADIKAFFRGPENRHAQCLFPARWWWLKQQLGLPDSHDVRCPLLESFMIRVAHHRLYLVFPTMYLNNPGSTFGHTFLRFDSEDESILLSDTLNYAARVDRSDNIISYVSKGLFGGYQGIFRMKPYYKTVQEYSNIENRDIWEYRLNFTEAEIQQLVRHVWEVKAVDFDYYFFRENCAYRLLALLDVVRPGMHLTGSNAFPVNAIPVDTVRALDDAGVIESRKFRASLASQINADFDQRSRQHVSLVLDILADENLDKEAIDNRLKTLVQDSEKLAVLTQSYNILHFRGSSSSGRAQHLLQLMNDYSASAADSADDKEETELTSPEKGHRSVRFAAGYGEQNSAQYIDLKFRPAFHDLLDAPQGYIDGAAINVFDTRLKWFTGDSNESRLRLESLSFFNVTSFSPLRRWKKSLSWTLDFSFNRRQLSETHSAGQFMSRAGAGFSVRMNQLTPFILLNAEWDLSAQYDKGYSLFAGLQAGLHFNYASSQFLMSYEKANAVSGFDLEHSNSEVQWQYNLQVNHAVRVSYRRTEYDFFTDEDWSLNYHYYF